MNYAPLLPLFLSTVPQNPYIMLYFTENILLVYKKIRLPNPQVSGGDFYRDITSQGDKLAYVTWDHPNMPWDTTAIYTARLSLAEGRVVVSDTQLVGLLLQVPWLAE